MDFVSENWRNKYLSHSIVRNVQPDYWKNITASLSNLVTLLEGVVYILQIIVFSFAEKFKFHSTDFLNILRSPSEFSFQVNHCWEQRLGYVKTNNS